MTTTVSDDVQVVSECLDTLRERLRGLDDEGIGQALRDIEGMARRVQSVMLDAVAELDTRRIAMREGFGTTARLLAGMLHLSAGEARTRVEHAQLVGARRGLSGEALAPRAPATAAGLAAGQIGPGQLRVIAEALAALPVSVPGPVREQVDADLAGFARDFDPRRLRTVAQRVIAHLDPDGPEPAEEPPPTPTRGELWLRPRRDGRLGFDGWLGAEHGALFRSLIEQLATPRPATDGARDLRGVPARQADALIELCELARAGDGVPTAGGEPPHVSVLLDWETLRTGLGSAILDHGQRVSAADARRMACDALLIPIVLGTGGEPLDVGRAARAVPRGIRRALVARDRGCAFPGCDRPPGLCAVHHVQHWADHGVSAVANCCLLCVAHHQQVHRQRWHITIRGGHVEFRPPTILGPDRTPLTNPLRR